MLERTQEDSRVNGKVSSDTNRPNGRECGKGDIILRATSCNSENSIDKQCDVE